MGVFAFRQGPTYRAATPEDQMAAALDTPMSLTSTLGEQFKGGILDSLGLGTAIREASLPEEAPSTPTVTTRGPNGELITLPDTPQMRRRATVQGFELQRETPEQLDVRRRDVGALDEQQFKSSPYFRDGVKWDAGMTEDRAAALAEAYDVKRVREYFATKRPITSFIGNLAGQAVDPINYIPIAGPAVKAANAARFGRVAGSAATGALDAAANTAIASGLTFDARKSMGDDITWQSTISDIAMAAMIGSAFGSIGGVVEARRAGKLATAQKLANDRLSTLRNVQDARVALNDAIGGLARGDDVSLGGNAADAVQRISTDVSRVAARDLTPVPVGQEAVTADQVARLVEQNNSPIVAPRKPQRLFDFLAAEGGVKDTNGDLAAIGVGRKFVPGRGALVRNAGLDPDKAREAAAQAGYFDHIYGTPDEAAAKSTVRDLLDLIDQENGGSPAYSMKDADRVTALQEYENALSGREDYKKFVSDLAQELNKLEIGVSVDDAVLARATDMMVQEKLSPLDAFDRAVLEDEARFEASLAERGGSYRDDPGYADIPFFDEPAAIDGSAGSIAGRSQQDSGSGRGGGNAADSRQSPSAGRNAQQTSVDLSAPKPELPPTGKAEAAARVAKPETFKTISEQYRVNPDDGSFVEQADIDQIRKEGRITPEDEMELNEAQATFDNGLAFGEALKAAASCII